MCLHERVRVCVWFSSGFIGTRTSGIHLKTNSNMCVFVLVRHCVVVWSGTGTGTREIVVQPMLARVRVRSKLCVRPWVELIKCVCTRLRVVHSCCCCCCLTRVICKISAANRIPIIYSKWAEGMMLRARAWFDSCILFDLVVGFSVCWWMDFVSVFGFSDLHVRSRRLLFL